VTRLRSVAAAALLLVPVASAGVPARPATAAPGRENLVRIWPIRYVAHDGLLRRAFVVLPRWYGPHDDPPLPLVISPHGRGVPAIDNVRLWGNLPAIGRFAVVNPEGQGRRLALFAWGDPGDVGDLAAMPQIVHDRLPWLRVDRRRIYAFGGSMGGQETLLLVARYPRLLAGAAAFDAPTNMSARYFAFSSLRFGSTLQERARLEIGGTPLTNPHGYRLRSPLDWARHIAFSGVPLQIWWSRTDRIVTNQAHESGALYREIRRLNPAAPVVEVVGRWRHTAEMRPWSRLPVALRLFGLMPPARAHAGGLRAPGAPKA
jgi:poly(3-hydroxybutyrate) depolymerase